MSAPMEAIPMLDLEAQNAPLSEELREAFDRVLRHGRFILGPEVTALEQALVSREGFAHAVSVSSGTDALLLALMALDIGPGDEVITTPFSFFATAGCIHRVGARPVFVDIDPVSFNLDPAGIAAAVTPRTKAVIPVHLYGRPADMQGILAVASAHGLWVIEDAAQALGAGAGTQRVGCLGTMGCFSFFPSKNLGGFGDAGLVSCGDAALAQRLRILRAHGASPKYFHGEVGGNFRMDTLQAALLAVKLPHLSHFTARRRAHAATYEGLLSSAGLPASRLTLPERVEGHVFNQYVLRTDRRDALQAALGEAQIASEIYYPRPLHLQACFSSLGYRPGDLPHAERASREVLALPMYPELERDQLERVAGAVVCALG